MTRKQAHCLIGRREGRRDSFAYNINGKCIVGFRWRHRYTGEVETVIAGSGSTWREAMLRAGFMPRELEPGAVLFKDRRLVVQPRRIVAPILRVAR